MKKLLTLTLVLLASISIFAQEKIISKEEFEDVQRKGWSKYSSKSYRVIGNTEYYQGDTKMLHSTKEINEVASADRYRSVFESISPSSVSRIETIKITSTTYTKRNNEEWKIAVPDNKPKTASPISTIEQQIDYQFLGNEKLDNQNTTVYQYILRRKMISFTNNNETFSSTVTHKYWFGEDGGILKQELINENRAKPNNPNFKERVFRDVRTSIWELDPNIKIEAPKIN